MRAALSRFFQSAWRDAATRSGFILRAANVMQGTMVAASVVMHLNPVQQGIWYSLASLLMVAALAEMGFGQVVVQIVAHDLVGSNGTPARRAAYFQATVRFAGVAGIGYAALLISAAAVFFLPAGHWDQLAVIVCAALAGGLVTSLAPITSFLEGSQHIASANQVRAMQSIAYATGCAIALACGAGLWAIPFGYLASLASAISMIGALHGREIAQTFRAQREALSWKKTFWPLQSRYALSWISSMLFHTALSPLLLLQSGPIEAGKFGLTWSLMQAALGVSVIWIYSRMAKFAADVASGNGELFRAEFRKRFIFALATFTSLACVCVAAVAALHWIAPEIALRFLDIPRMLLLAFAVGFVMAMQLLVNFARSFREEPFVRESWISAVVVAAGAWALARPLGSVGVSIAIILGQLVTLPSVLRKNRAYSARLDHAQAEVPIKR